MWYDVRPLRPDEFGAQQAGRWRRTELIQQAFQKGVKTVQLEEAKKAARKAGDAAEQDAIRALKQKAGYR